MHILVSFLFIIFLICFIKSTIRTKVYKTQTASYGQRLHRRHRPPETPQLPLRLQNRQKKKEDGYFEPYWENGEWIFHRSPTKTPDVDHNECNQVCLYIYNSYSIVCGMRLRHDEWVYDFRTFDDMCQLELENCKNKTKRFAWFPAYKGNCTEDMTTYPTHPNDIVSRKVLWLQPYE